MFKTIIKSFSALFIFAALFYSCGEQVVQPPALQETVLYQNEGLVDSACVNGCYSQTMRFFIDPMDVEQYKTVKIKFKGETNSDGSYISVLLNSETTTNQNIYTVRNLTEINEDDHSIDIEDPTEKIWLEMRIYINPPVCGYSEFKYTKVSDLVIYGIK